MNLQDSDNLTFLSDTDKVYSEEGQRFHREKYLPKLERVKKHLQPDALRSLDIGIGYGSFMRFTKQELGLEPHGLDPYSKSIEIAKYYVDAQINFGRIEDDLWPYPKEHFDFISCLDVTEHLEDPSLFYKNVKNYLKSDGIVLMTTPLREFPYEMRSWPLIGIPDRNTTHINVHPPLFWDRLAKENGFEILESWKGEHLTHVKYVSGALRRLCNALGVDPVTTPLINSFQQAYNQILRLA
ncbi:MAG: class I SAM-dependent methyltransferase [Flavobacteriales bacterium]|nr:class I SAM-dependent methyltransferase [Flavobacteriales bacterium]